MSDLMKKNKTQLIAIIEELQSKVQSLRATSMDDDVISLTWRVEGIHIRSNPDEDNYDNLTAEVAEALGTALRVCLDERNKRIPDVFEWDAWDSDHISWDRDY